MVITIDGGVASGKSSISEILAKRINGIYIQTGKLYRLIMLFYIKNGYPFNDLSFLENIKLNFKDGNFQIEGFDYEIFELFQDEVVKNISSFTIQSKVRDLANSFFRNLIFESSIPIVLEGRDAGTIIFPDTPFKYFLKVNDDVAAERRFLQEQKNGNSSFKLEDIKKDIVSRNLKDSNRSLAPLIKPLDSIEIDTSFISREEVVNKIIESIKQNDKK